MLCHMRLKRFALILVFITFNLLRLRCAVFNDLQEPYSQESFDDACDIGAYAYSSPKSSLPVEDTTSRAIPSQATMQRWYDIGLHDCESHYEEYTNAYKDEDTSSAILTSYPISHNTRCRGNALFYKTTGLLIWPFGPMKRCPTHAHCWFGLLTCGQYNHTALHEVYSSAHMEAEWSKLSKDGVQSVGSSRQPGATEPLRLSSFNTSEQKITSLPSFNGWSLRAVHVYSRVVGVETVVPEIHHMVLNLKAPALSSSSDSRNPPVPSTVSVLIGTYALTIPGDYTVEMKLNGLYPGVLYNWTRQQVQEGRHAMHSVFLGGCEPRCRPYVNCGPFSTPECEDAAYLGATRPIRMKSTYSSHRCLHNKILQPNGEFAIRIPSDQARHSGQKTTKNEKSSGRVASVDPLPFCTGGHHAGRWIKIPPVVADKCGAAEFTARYVAENEAQIMKGGRRNVVAFQRITNEYRLHAEGLDIDDMWAGVLTVGDDRIISGVTSRGEGPDGSLHDTSLLNSTIRNEMAVYYNTLRRYASGNICKLFSIFGPASPLDSPLELFAPYTCRYHIFSQYEASRCLRVSHRDHLLFHGDSMTRNLYNELQFATGVTGKSYGPHATPPPPVVRARLPATAAKRGGPPVRISEFYSWDYIYIKPLIDLMESKESRPKVYIFNMALAHNFEHNLTTIYNKTLWNSNIVQYWKRFNTSLEQAAVTARAKTNHKKNSKLSTIAKSKVPPILRIYQSASMIHGKRHISHNWMNHVVRTQNEFLRRIFVDSLGFKDFDEWATTAGKPDLTDGWHYNFSPRRMNAHILLNMACSLEADLQENGVN